MCFRNPALLFHNRYNYVHVLPTCLSRIFISHKQIAIFFGKSIFIENSKGPFILLLLLFFFLIKSTFAIKHRIVNGDHVLIPLNRSPSLVKFPSCLSLDFGLILYLSVQGTWPTHRMPSALQHQPVLHIPDSHGMDLRSLY